MANNDYQKKKSVQSSDFQVVNRSGKAKISEAKIIDPLMMPGGVSSLKEPTLADYVVTGSQKERKAARKAQAKAAADEK